MIKIKQHGFTVIEILLTLGIISVIATMGFTFAKKGVENSYNYYVYTAYKGITDAITEANLNNTGFTPVDTAENFFRSGFYEKVEELLLAPNSVPTDVEDGKKITTSNGTEIIFKYDATNKYVPIEVFLPAQRGTVSKLCLKYLPESNTYLNLNILVPTAPNITDADNCTSNVDLLNRADLVSFYIDDGLTGHVVQGLDDNGNPTTTEFKGSLEYMSAHDAICKVVRQNDSSATSYSYADVNWVNGCTGSGRNGIIKFAAPRRFLK